MNTTVECQVLFHQCVDFISQNKNVSIREIKAATPTNDIDSKVRQLEISHESDSSISVKAAPEFQVFRSVEISTAAFTSVIGDRVWRWVKSRLPFVHVWLATGRYSAANGLSPV